MSTEDFVSIHQDNELLTFTVLEDKKEFAFEQLPDGSYIELADQPLTFDTHDLVLHYVLAHTEFTLLYDAYYLTKPAWDYKYPWLGTDAYYAYRQLLCTTSFKLILNHKYYLLIY